MTIARRAALTLAAAVICSLLAPTLRSDAAFPGSNGLIAFGSERDGNAEIYVMKPDGSEQTRLTNNTVEDVHPHFSPTGSKIAFASSSEDVVSFRTG